jgi:hypothetical protein
VLVAGIGLGAEIDIEVAGLIDDEGMHRVIAGQRQAGDDDFRWRCGHDVAVVEPVADDAIVLLDVEGTAVNADTGAARGTVLDAGTEAADDVGLAVALRVPERDDEAAGRQHLVRVVAAAPRVDVDGAVRRHGEMAGVAEMIREHGGAEAGWQRQAGVAGRARRGTGRWTGRSGGSEEEERQRRRHERKAVSHHRILGIPVGRGCRGGGAAPQAACARTQAA